MMKALKSLSHMVYSALLCGSLAWASPLSAAGSRGKFADLTRDGQPNIRSTAAFVTDLRTGEVLYARDVDSVRPIASISKLMGALVIHEECKLNPSGMHVMTKSNREAAKGGDHSKLTTGWAFSHQDILHAALLRSDNRALPALGEACGLTPAQLGEKMTARARKLGLNQTSFKEPNGLSIENVSTAREVAVFLKEVIKYAELSSILTTTNYVLTGVKDDKRRTVKIRNTDRLLSRDIARIIGGKTGYTDPARYCFAVAANLNDVRDVAMVFLGAEGKHTRFADFTRVVKWLNIDRDGSEARLAKAPTVAAMPASVGVSAVAAAAAMPLAKSLKGSPNAARPAGEAKPSLPEVADDDSKDDDDDDDDAAAASSEKRGAH